MRLTKKTLPKIIEDMKACREIAKAAIVGLDDDRGSCNTDSPKLMATGFGTVAEEAFEAAGFSAFVHHGIVVNIGVGGQAYTRTKGAETFMKAMRERGYEMSMHYQVD